MRFTNRKGLFIMKKSIAFLLCVCMILSLAACGVAAPKEPAQEQTPVVEQKPADDAAVNLSGGAVLGSEPKGEYNEGVVLVKVEEAFNAAALGELFRYGDNLKLTLEDAAKANELLTLEYRD